MTKARILANLISDNAELADGQISVAEVVGAAPLASPTFTGTTSGTFSGPLTGNVTGNLTGNVTGAVTGDVTAPEIDLSAIAKDIADTAVDVFVYDTSKDSDGGAWRKRTQGTSWYNEAASSTRGSRKEFPSVAVIVAESNQVTIYDGDDPDMPMWMVFNASRTPTVTMLNWFTGSQAVVSSVAQLNGRLCVGTDGGVTQFDFVEDAMYLSYSPSTAYTPTSNRISSRNDNGATNSGSSGDYFYFIVSASVNDVAMTVLPNAPIDAATGLSVPTIAVATNSGVSVISDTGSVYDITNSSSTYTASYHVSFDSKNNLWFHQGKTELSYHGWVYVYGMPLSGDTAITINSQVATGQNPIALFQRHTGSGGSIQFRTDGGDSLIANTATGNDKGIGVFDLNTENQYASMAFQSTSDFNTGWQVGDIKLATLSDTDDTDVTGSELVTNGTFASDSNWTKGSNWSIANGVATTTGANSASASRLLSQTNVLTVGETYTLSVHINGSNVSANNVYFSLNGPSTNIHNVTSAVNSTFYITFVATTTTLEFTTSAAGNYSGNFSIDNVSVRLASEIQEDRSLNGNGLQVFGSITKDPVATGADLVGYSGFSSSNYLEQPYNSDLDFGTGDFCYIWWANIPTSSFQAHFTREHHNGTTFIGSSFEVFSDSGSGKLKIFMSDDGYVSYDAWVSASTISGMQCFAVVRQGGLVRTYIDGALDNTHTISAPAGSMSNTSAKLYVGVQSNLSSANTNGSIALFRASATAPSPEQIAKIYNDEKHLFQENAQATLYGSSDAVTALAYDDSTDLLHVGTSAGRSVFQGLRRVDNTTDAVGAAISASNGLVAED